MGLELDNDARQRLIFIKSLYRDGVAEAQKSQPYASKSILRFHDAVELFLKLVADKTGANDASFKGYWDKIEGKTGGEIRLSHNDAMASLDEARGNLKHFDLKYEKSNITRFKEDVREFLEENTEEVFGEKFSEISESTLIENGKARNYFEKGVEYAEKEKHKESLEEFKKSFEILVMDFEEDKKNKFQQNPFRLGEDLTFVSAENKETLGGTVSCPNNEPINKVKSTVEEIQEAMKVSMMGVDMKKYARFNAITPHAIRINGGEQDFRVNYGGKFVEPDHEDAIFCREFLIEAAITLQSNDFDIKYNLD